MKKTIIGFMLVAVSLFAACSSGNSSDSKKDSATTSTSDTLKIMGAVKYTCTMHPEVISDTPGHCPKCGMTMVPVKNKQ